MVSGLKAVKPIKHITLNSYPSVDNHWICNLGKINNSREFELTIHQALVHQFFSSELKMLGKNGKFLHIFR